VKYLDERRDVAILQVKGWNLPFVEPGNSDSVRVGDRVVVIGNPLGLENTITDGLISGKRDTGEGFTIYQISAPISHGSSGSPVFNRRGEVVGIASYSIEGGQNLNFFIPINYARGNIGSNVQMSIHEYFGRSRENAKRAGLPPERLPDLEAFVVEMHNIIVRIYSSYDNFVMGIDETTAPHSIKFNPSQYRISPTLLLSRENIELALDRIDQILPPDLNSYNLLAEYRMHAMRMKEGIELAMQGLKKYQFSNIPVDWNIESEGEVKVLATIGELARANKAFYQLIRTNKSSIETTVLPIIKLASVQEAETPFIRLVPMHEVGTEFDTGIFWALSRRNIFIVRVQRGSRAAVGGFVTGDEILSEIDGKEIKSIIDLFELLNKKRGETVGLVVMSRGSVVNKYLNMGAKTSKTDKKATARKDNNRTEGLVTAVDSQSRLISIELETSTIQLRIKDELAPLPSVGNTVTIVRKNDPWTFGVYFYLGNELIRLEANSDKILSW